MTDTTSASLAAADYRVIERVASLTITGNGHHAYDHNVSVRHAFDTIAANRGAATVGVIFETIAVGGSLTGPPNAVLPVLAALLSHADPGASRD